MSVTLILAFHTSLVPSEKQTRQPFLCWSVIWMNKLIYYSFQLRFDIHLQTIVLKITTLGQADTDGKLKARTGISYKLLRLSQHLVPEFFVYYEKDHLFVTRNIADRVLCVPECVWYNTESCCQGTDVTVKAPETYFCRKVIKLQPLIYTSEPFKRKESKVQSLLDVKFICTSEEPPSIVDSFSSSMYQTVRRKCCHGKGNQKEDKVNSFHHTVEAIPLASSGHFSHFVSSRLTPIKSFPVDDSVNASAVTGRCDNVKGSEAMHHPRKAEVGPRVTVLQNNLDPSDVELFDHLDAISSLDSSPNPMEWVARIDQVNRQSTNSPLLDLQQCDVNTASSFQPTEEMSRIQEHNKNLLESPGPDHNKMDLLEPEERYPCQTFDLIHSGAEALQLTAARMTCMSNIAYSAFRDPYITCCFDPPFPHNEVNSKTKSVLYEDFHSNNALKKKRKHRANIKGQRLLRLWRGRVQDVRVVLCKSSKISNLKVVGCFYCCKGSHDTDLGSAQEPATEYVFALKEGKEKKLSHVTEKGEVSAVHVEREVGADHDESCHRTLTNHNSAFFNPPFLEISSIIPKDHLAGSCAEPFQGQSELVKEELVGNAVSGKSQCEHKVALPAVDSCGSLAQKRKNFLPIGAAKSFAFTQTTRKQMRSPIATRSHGCDPLGSKSQHVSCKALESIALTCVGCIGTPSELHSGIANKSSNVYGSLQRGQKPGKGTKLSSSETICREKQMEDSFNSESELNDIDLLVRERKKDNFSANLSLLSVQIFNTVDKTSQRVVSLGMPEEGSHVPTSLGGSSLSAHSSQHGSEHRSGENVSFSVAASSWLQKCSSWLREVQGPKVPQVGNSEQSFNPQPKDLSPVVDPCSSAEPNEAVGMDLGLSCGLLRSTIADRALSPNNGQLPCSEVISDERGKRVGQCNTFPPQDQLVISEREKGQLESIKSAAWEPMLPEWKFPRATERGMVTSEFNQGKRLDQGHDFSCDPECLPFMSIEINNTGDRTLASTRIVRLKPRAGFERSCSASSLQDSVKNLIKFLPDSGERDSEATTSADEGENERASGSAQAANCGKKRGYMRPGLLSSSSFCEWEHLSEGSRDIHHTSSRSDQQRSRMCASGKVKHMSPVALPCQRVGSESEIENLCAEFGRSRSQSPTHDGDSLASFALSDSESISNVATQQCNQSSKGKTIGSLKSDSNGVSLAESLKLTLSPSNLSDRDDLCMGIVDDQDDHEFQRHAGAFLEAKDSVKSSPRSLCFPSLELSNQTLTNEFHQQRIEDSHGIQSWTLSCAPTDGREETAASSSDTMDSAPCSVRWCKVVVSDIAKDPQYKELFSKRQVRAPTNFQVQWQRQRGTRRPHSSKKGLGDKRRNKTLGVRRRPNSAITHASPKRMRITGNGARYIASLMMKQPHYAERISHYGVVESSLQRINRVFYRERSFWSSL